VACGLWPRPWGEWPRLPAHRIQRTPERDPTPLVRWLVSHHAVERARLAQRAHGPLVHSRTPDEVGNVGEWSIGQCLLELLASRGAKAAHESETETDFGNVNRES
jgi:hypothetical protein